MTNNLKLLSAALLMTSSITFAEQQLIEVESFSGVSVGTGLISTVTCGNTNQVRLNGPKKSIERLEVGIDGDTLDVSRKSSAGSMFGKLFSGDNFNDGEVKIDIVTSGEIALFDISTGASMKVDACAVNTSQVTVDGSTGSDITINGVTTQLNLDLSTGSSFNRRNAELTVDSVELDLGTGASANLCGASNVTGDASTGATLYVSSSVDTSNIDFSTGAEASSRRCR